MVSGLGTQSTYGFSEDKKKKKKTTHLPFITLFANSTDNRLMILSLLFFADKHYPVSILHKSIADRYRPVRV